MNTSTATPEIVAFARGVRAALADLPAEEVDDLTEGLEADLAESLADDLRRTLPDPEVYAAELRNAAGLPTRSASARAGSLAGATRAWNDLRDDVAATVRRNPALADAVGFLITLRPVWWVARAVLAAWLVAMFFGPGAFGISGIMWPVLLVFVTISVQWGRGRWMFRGVGEIVTVGNIAAVVILPVLASAGWWGSSTTYIDDGPSVPQGLALDGAPVQNIYAYDAAGNPLTGVQLFDPDGRPLETTRDVEFTQLEPQPTMLETGASAYNVYPLTVLRMVYDEYGELVPDPNPGPGTVVADRNGPFVKVPAVQTPETVAKNNE